MRRKDESKKPIISDFINAFYYEHDKVPSVREIVEGTGIPLSTVHRYLVDMQEKGELSYNGYRSARTKEMSEVSSSVLSRRSVCPRRWSKREITSL